MAFNLNCFQDEQNRKFLLRNSEHGRKWPFCKFCLINSIFVCSQASMKFGFCYIFAIHFRMNLLRWSFKEMRLKNAGRETVDKAFLASSKNATQSLFALKLFCWNPIHFQGFIALILEQKALSVKSFMYWKASAL